MFTGMIEELGTFSGLERGARQSRLEVRAERVLEDVHIGDSIAVNGVCLTVTRYDRGRFSADVMEETLNRSNLGSLKSGSRVNLERALQLSSRLGGHLVQGHIDGQGIIRSVEKAGIAQVFWFSTDPALMPYIVVKGSIAVDGISLTVVETDAGGFSISLIPHSSNLTTLGFKRSGDSVNLETDIIGRYVERLLSRDSKALQSRLDANFLAEHGFW